MGGESAFGTRPPATPSSPGGSGGSGGSGAGSSSGGYGGGEKTKTKSLATTSSAAAQSIRPSPPLTSRLPSMSEERRQASIKWARSQPQRPQDVEFKLSGVMIDGQAVSGAAILGASKIEGSNNYIVVDPVSGGTAIMDSARLISTQANLKEMHRVYLERHKTWFKYGQSKGWAGQDEIWAP